MFSNFAISWGLSGVHGWGVYGVNLVSELLRTGNGRPILLGGASIDTLPGAFVSQIAPYLEEGQAFIEQAKDLPEGSKLKAKEAFMLHSLGNGFNWSDVTNKIEGEKNVGLVFFERANFNKEEIDRANMFDLMIAGSSWNANIMREKGVNNVHIVLQGVDTGRFRTLPRGGHFGDKFVVFSGGKLEFRKGQDIALAAFRKFRERHDDAILVTAWQNHWPETAFSINSAGHIDGVPEVDKNGLLKISEWAHANGLPEGSFADLGVVKNEALPMFLSEMDVGLFLSRCEGGTNLAAMESMACGVPCILSANTGHLDLIGDDNCYPMRNQDPILSAGGETEGWGETSVDEVVDALEQAYTDRAGNKRRGVKAAEMMQEWSWEYRISELLSTIQREVAID